MMNKNALKIWKFRNKFVSLQRQNVVRGREQFAFGAEFSEQNSSWTFLTII